MNIKFHLRKFGLLPSLPSRDNSLSKKILSNGQQVHKKICNLRVISLCSKWQVSGQIEAGFRSVLWQVSGRFVAGFRPVCGRFPASLCQVQASLWQISGQLVAGFMPVCDRFQASFWQVSCQFVTGFSTVCVRFQASLWQVQASLWQVLGQLVAVCGKIKVSLWQISSQFVAGFRPVCGKFQISSRVWGWFPRKSLTSLTPCCGRFQAWYCYEVDVQYEMSVRYIEKRSKCTQFV